MTHPVRTAFCLVALVLVVASCAGDERVYLERKSVSVHWEENLIGVSDNCHNDPRLEVTENSTRIEIAFSVAEEDGGDCNSCILAELKEAVGSRTIVDKTSGNEPSIDTSCFRGG